MVVRQLFDEKMEPSQGALDFVEQFVMEIIANFCDSPLMALKEIQSNIAGKDFRETNDLKKTMSGRKL
ncbi:hypothetical protein [Scytonema sp. PCC 10023]|uniref:hypothetical protein n=1 Tax=Scytonema sp. PCC 10023 TaxID=1680591 RepID=UPI0039C6748D